MSRLAKVGAVLGTVGSTRSDLYLVLWPAHLLVMQFRPFRDDLVRALERRIGPLESGGWDSLREALVEIVEELDLQSPAVSAALAPPLARVKTLHPPTVPGATAESLVRRNLDRYFPVSGAHGVGLASALGSRRLARAGQVVAACSPERTLNGLISATDEAGINLRAVVPAGPALVEGLRASAELPTSGRGLVQVECRSWREALLIERGCLSAVLSVDRGGTSRPPVEKATADEVLVTELAAADAAVAAERPWEIEPPTSGSRLNDEVLPRGVGPDSPVPYAGVLAGIGMKHERQRLPQLRSEDGVARDRNAERRSALGMAAAVVLLLAVATLVHLWGLGREVEALQAERRRVASVVDRAVEAERAIQAVVGTLEVMDSLRSATSNPLRTILTLSEALPPEAFLHRLRMHGDTLWIEGEGLGSVAVANALERETSAFSAVADPQATYGTHFRARVVLAIPERPSSEGGGP